MRERLRWQKKLVEDVKDAGLVVCVLFGSGETQIELSDFRSGTFDDRLRPGEWLMSVGVGYTSDVLKVLRMMRGDEEESKSDNTCCKNDRWLCTPSGSSCPRLRCQ